MQITIEKSKSNHPKLTWSSVPQAKSYQIFRSQNPEGSFSLQFETTRLSYINIRSKENTCYYYKIRPVFEDGKTGEFSAVVSNNPDWTDCVSDAVLAYRAYNEGLAVTRLLVPAVELVIPSEVNGVRVVRIDPAAFQGCTSLNTVTVPKTVQSVCESAFAKCTQLETVTLPSGGLTSIPENCFADCSSLQKIELPGMLTEIGAKAFQNCASLHSMEYCFNPMLSKRIPQPVEKLPPFLELIGEEAFSGCTSLLDIVLPPKIRRIQKRTFAGCTALRSLSLHRNLRRIDSGAFSGCSALTRVRMPDSVTRIADSAFARTSVSFICETADSAPYQYAEGKGIPASVSSALAPDLCSSMKDYSDPREYTPFYTKAQLQQAELAGEFRPAFPSLTMRRKRAPGSAAQARYTCRDGIYTKRDSSRSNHARIVMTGDVMCKTLTQNSAFNGKTYDFSACFAHVKPVLAQSDLAICNLETMLSRCCPLNRDVGFSDGCIYLNSPEQLASALRDAGFDCTVNAQNHIYDAGVRGIFETLEVLNRSRLIHTGAFAGKADQRFVIIEVNQIKIAVLAYLDRNLQFQKRVLFTEHGLDTHVNIYDQKRAAADIAAAKKAGADFILVYCHFGKEITETITDRQRSSAQELAEAGADFIMGSHSHCLQPCDILRTSDGRSVPVAFSGGNFLSDMPTRELPNEDTAIFELELSKQQNRAVTIDSFNYYPFRILRRPDTRGGFVTYPVYGMPESQKEAEQLLKARRHIHRVLAGLGHTIPEKNSVALEAMTPGSKPSVAALSSNTYLASLPESPGGYPKTIVEACRLLGAPLPDDAVLPNPPSHYINLDELYHKTPAPILNRLSNALRDAELIQHVKLIFSTFREKYRAQEDLPFNKTDFVVWFTDYILFAHSRGAYAENYFGFDMYRRSTEERDKFMNAIYRRTIASLCNNRKYAKYMINKSLFNRTFRKYVQRDWVNTDECSLSGFTEFIGRHDTFFGKPVAGTGGEGASIIKTDSDTPENLYAMCREHQMLAEEVIRQHPSLAEFNASTVNTTRVYTLLCADNTVRIMMATMRIGRPGNVVDNFHNGGMGVLLDTETGEVISDASDGRHITYQSHPESGKVFRGFRYPHWDRVKTAVTESALLMPELRNIGWDVIVTEEGNVEFLEGNALPNVILPQATVQIGKRHLYDPHLKEFAEQKGRLFPEDEPWYIP